MITFRVLGSIDLKGPGGRPLASPLSGSKRLALLSYLALASPRGLQRRDSILGLFWPESAQRRARNALSNMLHHLRRALGPEAVVTRGSEEVGLAEASIWCDAVAFDAACREGRTLDALDLYRGDLLEGLFVSGASQEFDDWLHGERARLRRLAAEAAGSAAEDAERAGRHAEALRRIRRLLSLDPYDERAARRLIVLLQAKGDRAGALRAYEELAGRLQREFGAGPSPETRALLETAERKTTALAPEAPAESSPRSIAVIPFDNLSGSEDMEPFTAGLHDDLITELSRIAELTVISRSSVLRYRGAGKPAREIGKELGVGTVVEGSVQSTRERLRLNIQMIDARTEAHVWAERYDRALTAGSIFDIQSELAAEIARASRTQLTPVERERLQRVPTENLEAYRLCAQGRAQLDQRTSEAMHRAREYFQGALAEDPTYAPAWVGLADVHTLLYDYGHQAAEDTLPAAEEAVRRALELEPESAEACASLGLLHSNRREGPAAIRNLNRAVRLRPNYAEAHNWLSWVHQVMGHGGAALASAERAVQLNPLSPEAVSNLALSLLENGDAQGALREARRVRGLQPDWATGAFYEGLALYHLGRLPEAVEILRDLVVPWAGSGPEVTLAVVQAGAGNGEAAGEALQRFQNRRDAFAEGLVHAALGRPDQALASFLAVDEWSYWPVFSVHHFYPDVLGPLRKDPRFESVRRAAEKSWRQ